MMFTEGLDEKALDWVKQGTNGDQLPRSPLAERVATVPIQDPPLSYSTDYFSPSKLPPLKFHSGLLGMHKTSNFSLDDLDVDDESIGSAPNHIDMDCSDSDEEYMASNDSDFGKPSTVCDDDVRSVCSKMPALVRSKSKENLTVEIRRRNSMSNDLIRAYQQMGLMNSLLGEIGPPSAPPIIEHGSRFDQEGDRNCERLASPTDDRKQYEVIKTKKESDSMSTFEEFISSTNDKVKPDVTRQPEHIYSCARTISKETYPFNVQCQTNNMDQVKCYSTSGQSAWQTFIAYDACFRLCLNAWARDCMEAPEFLRDECNVLRSAFGLHKYLLKPRDQAPFRGQVDSSEETCTVKEKKTVGKVKVEVKRIRIAPQKKLRSIRSLQSIYANVGAQYVRDVSALVKTKFKSLKAATFPMLPEETFSCLLQLKSSKVDTQNDPGSIISLQPGSGDFYTFYPESQSDALLIEVQDSNNATQGQTTIHVSSLVDTLIDRVQWWPLYLGDGECVGKIQLSVGCSSMSSEIKSGLVVETFIYDLVLEAVMRALQFHSRNLRIHGIWKWLLDEFADYYGVSEAYTKLRYISFIMNVATPTKDCLQLLYELLVPVVEARSVKKLNRQEGSLLLDCEAQVEGLLATTFENYKSLDELSPTGLGDWQGPATLIAAPALFPAVLIYSLLHDILSNEAQGLLRNYLQTAAAKRCRRHMVESDEFMSGNYDIITDPMNISTAYLKMKSLCMNIRSEIQSDIKIHNQHILPSSIDLPNITGSVYSNQLGKRLHGFLKACPPFRPSQHVMELLTTTADFERDLQSWNISPTHGGVIARDLFHDYIMVWIQDMQVNLLELCKVDKVPWSSTLTHYSTSPFVENMYDQIKVSLSDYEVVIKRWPQYLMNLETVVYDVERAVLKALEKQYGDILTPLRDSIPKKLEKHVQKLTRRQSISIYVVPDQLATFLNTLKRMLDVLHVRIEDVMKSQALFLSVVGDGKSVYGEQINGITVMLRKKYKNYVQAIVEKLVNNTQANRNTRLKRILEDTKEADGESEIRERMQLLCSQLIDSISNLHGVFSARIFVTICRSFWDKMGQIILNFLESRKENRIWYKASEHSLGILDDLFASQIQTHLGNSLQERDLDPPRSVIEARSILC